MPIDLAAIAAAFTRLGYQDRLAGTAGRTIQAALDKRAADARAADVSSSRLPTLRFEGQALAVLVVLSGTEQQPSPPGRVLAWGVAPTRAAAAGWERWWHAAHDLPALIEGADALLAGADDTIRRYAKPAPELFDPRGRTMLDILGVASSLFAVVRRANTAGGDFDQIVATVSPLLRSPQVAGPLGAQTTAPPSGGQPADSLDATGLAGVVLLVSLPQLLATALTAVDLRIRLLALESLQGVERLVLGGLSGVYLLVFDAMRWMGRGLPRLLLALQVVVWAYVRGYLAFARAFGVGFGSAIQDFVFGLARFLRVVVLFAHLLVDLLELAGLDRWVKVAGPPIADRPFDYRSGFPDFGATLFGDDVRRRAAEALRDTGDAMAAALTKGLDVAATGLDQAARSFSRLADEPFGRGLPGHLAEDASSLATALFPHEVARSDRDPLAAAVESWAADDETWIGTLESQAAGGGVGVVVAVLKGYAREVAQQWRAGFGEEPAVGDHLPTSPHILRRHGGPQRVDVRQMTVRVGGPPVGPPGDDVLDRVADELVGAVVGAYRQGQRRLQASGAGR